MNLRISLLLLFFVTSNALAVENPLFGYTHLLPSPFTLPAGKIMLGTTSGVGITNYLEMDTNLLLNFFKIYNGRVRFSVLDFPGFAAGLYLGYQNANLNQLSSSNPSIRISSWMPGGVLGAEIVPYVALFFGGNFYYSNSDMPKTGIEPSGYLQGAQMEADLSWAYSQKKEGISNAISAGVTYNTTFNFYGFGVSHHWRTLHLGVHYYPNATNLRLLPILSGGAEIQI